MKSSMHADHSARGKLVLSTAALEGGPAHDVALGPVLLRRGLGESTEFIRIFTPEATAAFSRRDSKQPGFSVAARAASRLRFQPVVRACGGRLAAYHNGTVVIDHVLREHNAKEGMHQRFQHYSSMHAEVLRGLGLDARVGELPGEYCPGTYSVNAGGRSKIVGSAQRITRDGWLFSSIIQVTGSERIREVLEMTYREMGYPLNSATIGAMEDFVPGVSVAEVREAMGRAYSAPADRLDVDLPTEILDQVRTEAASIDVRP
jgi:octanoyl-[GcvH]:protein N-octanoyltransferase